MTSYVSFHRAKRSSHNAVIAKFERIRVRQPSTVFLFFEALLDRAVYIETVSRYFDHPIRMTAMLCDGRNGVLRVFSYVRSKHGRIENALFFIDKDLQEFLGNVDPNDTFLYISDWYSIESDFINPDAYRCILSSVLHVDEDLAPVDQLVELYEDNLHKFYDLCCPFMAWVILIKRLGGVINLNNVHLNDIFSINDDGVPCRRDRALATFAAQVNANVWPIQLMMVRQLMLELRRSDARAWIRGKYLLWFFIKSIEILKARLRANRVAGERAHFIDAAVDENSCIQLLVARLPRPASFTSFIETAALAYKNEFGAR